jgi:hypothetical protein
MTFTELKRKAREVQRRHDAIYLEAMRRHGLVMKKITEEHRRATIKPQRVYQRKYEAAGVVLNQTMRPIQDELNAVNLEVANFKPDPTCCPECGQPKEV